MYVGTFAIPNFFLTSLFFVTTHVWPRHGHTKKIVSMSQIGITNTFHQSQSSIPFQSCVVDLALNPLPWPTNKTQCQWREGTLTKDNTLSYLRPLICPQHMQNPSATLSVSWSPIVLFRAKNRSPQRIWLRVLNWL